MVRNLISADYGLGSSRYPVILLKFVFCHACRVAVHRQDPFSSLKKQNCQGQEHISQHCLSLKESKFGDKASVRGHMPTDCFKISWEQSTQKDEELPREVFFFFSKWLRTEILFQELLCTAL